MLLAAERTGYTLNMYQKRQKQPRLVVALYYYHPYASGVSIYAKRLAEGLTQSGYAVTVLTSRYDKALPKRELINGVKVIRRPVWFRWGKGVAMPTFWLDMVLHARKADCINTHLPLPDSGLAALFIPRRKMVTTYHCDIYLGPGLMDRLVAFVSIRLMRLQLGRSRAVVATTKDYLMHSIMKQYISKTVPIYPPISDTEFMPIDGRPLFRRLGVADTTVKIGFVGRIVYEKGISYLLQSIPYLSTRFPDIKVIIVGDYKNVAGGSIKDQLDRHIAEHPDKIIFTGYLTDVERNQFYSGLDVLVLPSIDPLEAFGMVQVEAMLCGAPVVASDLPGVREVIRKTGFGRISKVKDPKDIARQIVEVVTRKEHYKAQRDVVVRQFSAQRAIEEYITLLSN